MRRLLRILFNALTVLSFALAVLVAAFWAAAPSELHRQMNGSPATWVGTDPDDLFLMWADRPTSIGERFAPGASWALLGVRFYFARSLDRANRMITLAMPMWLLLIMAVALPTVRAVAWRVRQHREQRRAGLCPSCGYDLRATPERFPECGAVPTAVIA